jgi:UDP-glucuronate 4-epimerase
VRNMTNISARNGFPKRILITGGAGFIGSHVAEALLGRGADLAIVDNLDASYSPAAKRANLEEIRRAGNFMFHETDICDFARLREAFVAARPHAVIHLAVKGGVRSSFNDPLAYGYVNVTGTFHVLELCREFGVERFVLGSSSSIYGANSPIPFCEVQDDSQDNMEGEDQSELQPVSPYAVTKLEAERLAQDYARVHGLAVVCLRFFSIYGPRLRPNSAIFKFTEALESGNPLQLLGDGSSARDYTWVGDAVPAVLAALEYSLPGSHASANGNGNGNDLRSSVPFEVFNIGASNPVSLNHLVASLEKATGREAVHAHFPNQAGEVRITCADNSKAQRLLGFRPAMPLEEGLARFVAWYRSTAFRNDNALAGASAD